MGKAGSKQGWTGLDTEDPDRDRDDDSPERPTQTLIDDPRSPTQEVERTPIQALNINKDKNDAEESDPRSPSSNVPRTPLQKLDLSSADPREPTSGIERTPLNKENKTLIQQDILGAIEEEQDNEAEAREEHPVAGDDASGGSDVTLKETNNEGKRRNLRSMSLGQLSRSTPSYNQLESEETDDVDDDGLVLMGKKRTSLPTISLGKRYNKLSVDVDVDVDVDEDVHEMKLKLPVHEFNENDKENEREKTLKDDMETDIKNPDTESTKLITVK